MNHNHSVQSKLLSRIREQIPGHLSLVDEIAEVLAISTDSAYRRLRGETALSLDEAGKLSSHFKVPMHDLFDSAEDTVVFRRVYMSNSGFDDYLRHTMAYFGEIGRAKEKRGIYAAKDIPVFYHFLFPDLARFKLYFWLKSLKETETLQNQPFSLKNVPEEYITAGLQIAKIYLQIPFIEIWNDETPNSTIRQIEYYYEAGLLLEREDILSLLDQVEALIRHIQVQATRGVTLVDGVEQASYELYYNEILQMDNTILTESDGVGRILFSYDAMDYLHTADLKFYDEVKHWLQVQMKKSALISRVSEKERNRFFNKIYHRIEEARRKIR